MIRALVKEKTKTLRPRASVYERKTIEHTVANLVVANALLALHAPVNAARMQTVVQLYKYRSHLEANAAAETVFFERVTKDVAAFLVNMSADSLKEALKPVRIGPDWACKGVGRPLKSSKHVAYIVTGPHHL